MEDTFRRRLAQIVQIDKEGSDKYSLAYDWYMLAIIGLSLVLVYRDIDNSRIRRSLSCFNVWQKHLNDLIAVWNRIDHRRLRSIDVWLH